MKKLYYMTIDGLCADCVFNKIESNHNLQLTDNIYFTIERQINGKTLKVEPRHPDNIKPIKRYFYGLNDSIFEDDITLIFSNTDFKYYLDGEKVYFQSLSELGITEI